MPAEKHQEKKSSLSKKNEQHALKEGNNFLQKRGWNIPSFTNYQLIAIATLCLLSLVAFSVWIFQVFTHVTEKKEINPFADFSKDISAKVFQAPKEYMYAICRARFYDGIYNEIDAEGEHIRLLNTYTCHCRYIVAAQALCNICPKEMEAMGFKKVSSKRVSYNWDAFKAFALLMEAYGKDRAGKLGYNTEAVNYDNQQNIMLSICTNIQYKDPASALPSTIVNNFLELKNLKSEQKQLEENKEIQTITKNDMLYNFVSDEKFIGPLMNASKGSELDFEKHGQKHIFFGDLDCRQKYVHWSYFHDGVLLDGPYAFKKPGTTNQLAADK